VDAVWPSKKGWPEFDTVRPVWIPCPAVFRAGESQESWARMYSAKWWADSKVRATEAQLDGLAKMLADVRELTYRPRQDHVAVIHLPPAQLNPLRVLQPQPVGVGVWQLNGERDARLRLLTSADDPDVIEPPIVEEYPTEALGTGLKTLRYARLADGSLFGAVNYAFRSEEYETDLRFSSSCPDLSRLQIAMPDIDELVQTTSLRPRNR
jgi:hypothetical protein